MKILQEITVPQESVNDTYLTVIALNFKNGDAVKKDNVVIELETSKAGIEIHAEVDGYVCYLCKEGDEVALNAVIVQITDTPIEKPVVSVLPGDSKNASTKAVTKDTVRTFIPVFSKKAIALIEKHKLSQDVFNHFDFVNEDNVLDYLEPGRVKHTHPHALPRQIPPAAPRKEKLPEKITIKKIPASKKREIEYLSSVQKEGLGNTIFMDLDLPGFFESVNPRLEYFKDSILPVLIYESSRLLIKYPVLNSFFTEGNIAFYNEVNIGVAMDIDDGLKVVKMPQPDKMNFREIEIKLFSLANTYLDKKLTPADLSDITFTITDLSANGAYFFTPLINKDNAAILGVAKLDKKLKRIILGLTFDHRVTEGKTATAFLSELKERIESYASQKQAANLDNVMCYKCMKRIAEDINGKGFVKVVDTRGEEKLICDTCFLNY